MNTALRLRRLVLAACCLWNGCATAVPPPGLPVLCGTLVDPDERPVPSASFTLNVKGPNWTVGGDPVETDARGEFRIESWLLRDLVMPSDSRRLLVLVDGKGNEAVADVSQAFAVGVHYLGELTVAGTTDGKPLRRLSDRELLAQVEQAEPLSRQRLDTCLQECVRRGGATVSDYLAARARDVEWDQSLWRTAECRAARLPDPLVLELPAMQTRHELRCDRHSLPTVELRLVNRDAKGRPLDIRLPDQQCVRHPDLAVEVFDSPRAKAGYRLIPSGPVWFGSIMELAAGSATTLAIPLTAYIDISAPGTYRLRFAWCEGPSQLVEVDNNELVRGLLYLYSKPFTLVVTD